MIHKYLHRYVDLCPFKISANCNSMIMLNNEHNPLLNKNEIIYLYVFNHIPYHATTIRIPFYIGYKFDITLDLKNLDSTLDTWIRYYGKEIYLKGDEPKDFKKIYNEICDIVLDNQFNLDYIKYLFRFIPLHITINGNDVKYLMKNTNCSLRKINYKDIKVIFK